MCVCIYIYILYLGECAGADGLPNVIKSKLLDAVQVFLGLLLVLWFVKRVC